MKLFLPIVFPCVEYHAARRAFDTASRTKIRGGYILNSSIITSILQCSVADRRYGGKQERYACRGYIDEREEKGRGLV